MTKKTAIVTVTGAAGQIAYSLLFRIAHGDMLGADQPIELRMLDIARADGSQPMKGVAMELNDCAFPLLRKIVTTTDAKTAFEGCNYAVLVGGRPRSADMTRADLLAANAGIFQVQGKALNDYADAGCHVLVVANPCNTNCWVAMKNAPRLNPRHFSAMMRLDHNRSIAQIAEKTGADIGQVQDVVVWGNHAKTMYPDVRFVKIAGKPFENTDKAWYEGYFIPTVSDRGTAVIKARGRSSAASAANAAVDHVHDWTCGSNGRIVTMAVPSDGSYGIPEGLVFGLPCTCENGEYQIVQGLPIGPDDRARIDANVKAMLGELEVAKAYVG